MKRTLIRFLCVCLIWILILPQALAYTKLQKGSKGVEVTAMQGALKSLGYAITVDGSYGSATVNTVKAFQKKYGLKADGIAGNKTLTLLYSLVPAGDAQESAATAAPAASAPSSGKLTAVVATDNGGSLKFRAQASTKSSVVVLAYIPNGARIEILSQGSTWCKASYNGKTGYVMTEYLAFDSAAVTAAPVPQITATPALASSGAVPAYVSTANGGSLNLRSAAKSGNNIIATIPNGAALTVTARGSTWSQVIYNGVSGFVMSQYLVFGSAVTAAPTATPTPAPTAAPITDGSIAYVTTTNGKSLNLRKTASSSTDNVIAAIPNGTQLAILSRGSTWCKTSYGGKTGYVMTSFLSFPADTYVTPAPATATPAPAVPTLLTGYVNTSNGGSLNLRKSASDQVAVLAAIPNGAALTVTAKGDTWCAVTYNGISGYVMTKFLYIPVNQVTASPVTAAPASSSSSAYAYTRTLRSGDTGEDVRWVQNRLKELGYTVNVNSAYDSATITAVKAFQKKNGLTVDGLAGAQTFAVLNSAGARKATDADITYGSLNIDATGSAVTAMQNALIKLGYDLKATGTFDVDTHNAVVAFQVRNSLVISGIADGLTRTVLMSGSGKPYSTPVEELPANAGLTAAPDKSQIKLMHWQNEIKGKVKAGETFQIFDPQTNLSWNLKFYSLGRHADSQPATWRDTQIMNRSFGSTSWAIHPVYVKLPTGEWTIATMHNRPHLYGSIVDNGFGGHLCVHFLRTMSEAQQNDPDYGVQNQVTLRNAWKALTGETISY